MLKSVVLIQPREGVYTKILKPWAPLSLLSAAVRLDQEGYAVKIIDQRVTENWEEELVRALADNPVCVGITSMTGSQIMNALEVSACVKKHSEIPVVWGGVHSSLFPAQTLENSLIDYVIKYEGEETLYELVRSLESGQKPYDIHGLCYRKDDTVIENPDRPFADLNSYPHIPYHLIKVKDYLHNFFNEKEVLEIDSSRGCPYACTFCYNHIFNKRKWRALNAVNVVARVKKVVDDYGIKMFHFIDDGFFIDKKRAREIMVGILDAGLDIKMGFHGARIDTLASISDEDLDLYYKAGVRFLQFGVESGSPRILEMIKKRIKVEQVIALNQRLAKYPMIIPSYNFMCGFPTESREELFMSTSLAWTLLNDNKKAIVSPFHHYKPYPGTPLCEMAVDDDFVAPDSLEKWGRFDWTNLIQKGQSPEEMRFFKNVEMISILVDRKMEYQSDSLFWTMLAKLYRPIARYRFKNSYYSMMPEGRFMNLTGGS